MDFSQINKIKNLLNKKEKIIISFLFILMFLNSLIEILSIGMLIPLITMIFDGNNTSTFSNILFFDKIFNNLFISLDIRKILILIVLIFTTKNLFIIFYNYFLGITAMNIRLRLVNDLYKRYLSQNYEFFLSKNTSEIIRSGLNSIVKGQIESATAFGMNKFQAFKRILLPQAVRQSIPAYSNEIILMIKASSLVSIITIMEMTGIARKIISKTFYLKFFFVFLNL